MNTQSVKRTIALIGIVAASYGWAGLAQAEEGKPYVALELGLSNPSTSKDSLNDTSEFNNGASISAALGYGIWKNLRAEAEVFYGRNTADTIAYPSVNGGNPQDASGNVTSLGFMANGYYDFKTDMAIVPYIGAGIGFDKVSVNNVTAPGLSGVNDSDLVLAWQFKAGLSYAVLDNTYLTFGYQFFDTRDLSLVTKGGTSYTSDGARTHSIKIGLRYGF